MKKVLTAKDIQQILGVCEKTSYSLIHQALKTGMFKVHKVSRRYLVSRDSFLNWLDGAESI